MSCHVMSCHVYVSAGHPASGKNVVELTSRLYNWKPFGGTDFLKVSIGGDFGALKRFKMGVFQGWTTALRLVSTKGGGGQTRKTHPRTK